MWSLPDLKRLNSQPPLSTAQLNREKLERAVQTGFLDGKRLWCECGRICVGQHTHQLFYDDLGQDPRGILTQCTYHLRHYGLPAGFFSCAKCRRLMVESYSGEVYHSMDEDGERKDGERKDGERKDCERICLRCAADEYIADEFNWIALTDWDIATVTYSTLWRARHVLGVNMPVPKQIQLFDRVAFESLTCGLVRGFDRADLTPEAAAELIREILDEAKNAGHDRAILIVDGAYEFGLTIGVYISPVRDPSQQTDGDESR